MKSARNSNNIEYIETHENQEGYISQTLGMTFN